jgi:hypothetical protein
MRLILARISIQQPPIANFQHRFALINAKGYCKRMLKIGDRWLLNAKQ